LDFAYREVPYYRTLFDQLGLRPTEIGSLRDLERIPFLDKEVIRSRRDELQPKFKIAGTKRMSTGGSTGTPVTVFVDRSRAAFTDAVRMRAHRWFGVDTGAREIALWGSPIELGRQDWLRNARDIFINSRFLPAFNMSEQRMSEYGVFIQKYRPEKMYGYASSFYLLAEFLKSTNWHSPSELKVIFATAEPLYDFQRRTIEQVFQCVVAVEYGARDAGLMANECPKGGLHIPAEGMFIEIDSPDDTGLGEIVATNLFSNAMPIVRYRTGDMGRILNEPCPCGRALPRLKSIEGRRTDFLMTPSGRLIHALAIIYPLREMSFVKQFQVVQERLDKVILRIVLESKMSSLQHRQLMRNAQSALGSGIEIAIEAVDEIPLLASGKYRYVVSNVSDRYIKELSSRRALSDPVN